MSAPEPVPGRAPCPCGSGRRYKACHGRAEAPMVVRSFAGLADEAEWVALREVVPAATAPLRLADAAAGSSPVTLATVLPTGWVAMRRVDGAVFLGLQVRARSGDLSRDLADALLRALDAPPGTGLPATGATSPGPRLQDLLAPDPLQVSVHDGFDFWLAGMEDVAAREPELASSLERANASIVPTQRMGAAPAAYWARIGGRGHLRWVLPHEEEPTLDALARIAADTGLDLGSGTKYVGSLRAHGLLMPVWDLPGEADPESFEEPLAAVRERLERELAEPRPLEARERALRAGLLGRQLTVR